MENEEYSFSLHWIICILISLLIICIVVLLSLYAPNSSETFPSLYDCAKNFPESKVFIVFMVHISVLSFFIVVLRADYIYLSNFSFGIIFRYLGVFSIIFLLISTWCTRQEQKIFSPIFQFLFYICSSVFFFFSYKSTKVQNAKTSFSSILSTLFYLLSAFFTLCWFLSWMINSDLAHVFMSLFDYLMIIIFIIYFISVFSSISSLDISLFIE